MSRELRTPVLHSGPRNVHLWDDSGQYLGGLWQSDMNTHITNADFYDFVEMICQFNPAGVDWAIWKAKGDGSTGARLSSTQSLLERGRYLVLGNDGLLVNVLPNPERPVRRVPTQERSTSRLTSQQLHFRNTLRERDGGCAISGMSAGPRRNFIDKQASHIFPLSKRQLWEQGGWQNVITDTRPSKQISSNKMDSPQNGLLLQSGIHLLFDHFMIGVNPDRGYKVFCFDEDTYRVGGRSLSQSARQPSNTHDKISDDLLRWHFKQCVLHDMKWAGEPRWEENDFGDRNEIEQIMELGDAGLRMEEELFTRLGPHLQVSVSFDIEYITRYPIHAH